MKDFSIVIAVDEMNGIGKNGRLAWNIPEDTKFFQNITTTVKKEKKQNAVIMGRKTWESIPEKYRPLPKRLNCVLSSDYSNNTEEIDENSYGFSDFEKCLTFINKRKDIEQIFIIWGSYLYNLVLDNPYLDLIYITRVYWDFNCDVFFSDIPYEFIEISKSEKKKYKDIEYQFFVYKRKATLWEKFKKWLKFSSPSGEKSKKEKK